MQLFFYAGNIGAREGRRPHFADLADLGPNQTSVRLGSEPGKLMISTRPLSRLSLSPLVLNMRSGWSESDHSEADLSSATFNTVRVGRADMDPPRTPLCGQ